MRLSNKMGLPDALVRAIQNDGYNPGEKTDFSVTQLISSPRIRVLRKRHWHEIEDDVSDRIYSLLGQSIHTILERAEVSAHVEERLYAEVDGMTISGQFDRMVLVKSDEEK